MDLTGMDRADMDPPGGDPLTGDPRRDQLLEMALDSAAADVGAMPSALWDRIAVGNDHDPEGARRRRHPDWAHVEVSGTSPLDAFALTAAELGTLLHSLGAGDWTRRTRMEQTAVRDVALHLVGVERYLLGQLGRRSPLEADRREDHWPVARQASADLSGAAGEVVARQWWLEVLELISVCGELGPDEPVRSLDLPGNVRSLMVLRTFELWTHGDDIRQAVGGPLNLLDDGRLSLMSGELMQALPIGTALTGQSRPGRTARFCLTGSGGGTFDVPLAWGEAPGSPDIVVTVATIDLCRLAANRVRPDALDAVVEGDRSLLEPVLAAAAAFAAD